MRGKLVYSWLTCQNTVNKLNLEADVSFWEVQTVTRHSKCFLRRSFRYCSQWDLSSKSTISQNPLVVFTWRYSTNKNRSSQTQSHLNINPAGFVMPEVKQKKAIQGQNSHTRVLVRDRLSGDSIECFFDISHHLLTQASTRVCVCVCVWLCVFKPQAVCSDDDTARELKLPSCWAEM